MKCILLIVIYIVYLNSALASNGCPEDWSYYGESCYAYVNFKETWTGAAEICERFGGFLVEIDSSSENDFVKQLLRNSGAGSVWTGGNDLLISRKWSWLFSGKRITFTDWAPGEPHAGSTDRCIQLWLDSSYRWDDRTCVGQLAFVCERRVSPSGKKKIVIANCVDNARVINRKYMNAEWLCCKCGEDTSQ